MANQTNQSNDNTSFNDQSDGKMNQVLQNAKEKLSPGVVEDDLSMAEAEVRANEDASLQDDSYSFDEENTDNEEYHDADTDMDYDNDDDFVQ